MKQKLNIAIVDDHNLFRSGMIKLIQSLNENFNVVLESSNGQEFLNAMESSEEPDVLLLDISMPVLDGFGVAEVMQKKYPKVNVLVISMNDDELYQIRFRKFLSGMTSLLSIMLAVINNR